MTDKMKKMLDKKKGQGKMSEVEKDAKMSVVNHMKDMASKMMGDHVKGLKKVSIASNSGEGLKEGLHKAEEILDSRSEDGHSSMHDSENEMDAAPEGEVHDSGAGEYGKDMRDKTHDEYQEEAQETDAEKAAEDESGEDDMDEEELNSKLEKLMALKKKKEASKHSGY